MASFSLLIGLVVVLLIGGFIFRRLLKLAIILAIGIAVVSFAIRFLTGASVILLLTGLAVVIVLIVIKKRR